MKDVYRVLIKIKEARTDIGDCRVTFATKNNFFLDFQGQWEWEMAKVTGRGLQAILSSPWYLNYISYGSDWTKYYLVEPQSFSGSQAQKSLVIGGEAAMWGEFVNTINLTPRLWPRAGAVAERLWSAAEVRDVEEAAGRLQELECRMLQRGFPVSPLNGPSFCLVDWNA